MPNELVIDNFKSIKHLKATYRRVNVFIGEPNTGKSNILEALGLLSYAQFPAYNQLSDFVRYTRTTNLFYDDFIDNPFTIKLDTLSVKMMFKNGSFVGQIHNAEQLLSAITGNYNTLTASTMHHPEKPMPVVKSFRFKIVEEYPRPESEYLLPPYGSNLVSLLLSKREITSIINDIFGKYGLRLVLKPHENKIEIIKQTDNILISYPYTLISDTLHRVIFYLSAVLSNRNSVLVFEEPESHAFPFYTKYLAEIMALDEGKNQYFISTHNPYFLEPIVEKTPQEDICVFLTYFEDYETKVKPLTQTQIEELLRTDVFSNIDRFLKAA